MKSIRKTPEIAHFKIKMKKTIESLKDEGFNDVVVLGYRRVPDSEMSKTKHSEVPVYFHTFENIDSLSSIVYWLSQNLISQQSKSK